MKKIVSLVLVSCLSVGAAMAKSERVSDIDREIIIANNTNKELHWHMETLFGIDDRNGPIAPGAIHTIYTGASLERFEFTFKEAGKETEKRGYKIDLEYSADRDWMFTVDGEPFTGNWTVCGMRAKTAVASLAAAIAEIGGSATLVVAAIFVGSVASAATFGLTAPTAGAVSAATVYGLAEAAVAATMAAATLRAAGMNGLKQGISDYEKLQEMTEKMHPDKCEIYYNKRITLKNGSSDYMMVIQDAEKSVGVLPGKTFVVRQTLLDDKIKVKAYRESSKEDLLGEKEKVKRRNVTFTHDSKGWHVAKSGTNFNDDAETESRKTTFKNESAMPVSIMRNEKMSEPVEILAAQETDAAGNKVTDEVTNEHMLSDNFRYYGYMDEKPIAQEVTISWDKGDAILSLNGSAIGISYSRVSDE